MGAGGFNRFSFVWVIEESCSPCRGLNKQIRSIQPPMLGPASTSSGLHRSVHSCLLVIIALQGLIHEQRGHR
jgi:hypothetical protein